MRPSVVLAEESASGAEPSAESAVSASAQAASPEPDRPIQIPEIPADKDQLNTTAYLLRTKKLESRLEGLELFDSDVPIVLYAKDSTIKPTIAIRGQFRRDGWKLFAPEGAPALSSEFTVYAHLRGRLSEIVFTALGPNKQRQVERVYIYAPNARTYYVVSAWENLLFSAGLSGFSYTQTGFGVFESINMSAMVRYGSPDTDSFVTFLGSAEMMMLTLVSSPVSAAPQLLEAKADISVRTNKTPMARMRHRLLLGGTYLAMFQNGSPFGFSDLMAFEVGVQSRYIASARVDWIAEARFAPVAGIQALDQSGYNLNLAWSRLLENARRMELSAGYTSYHYRALENVTVKTSVLSLRAGISF